MKLDDFLSSTREQLESALSLTFANSPSHYLRDAIHYSLLDGGKRLRPALVRAAALAVGDEHDQWLIPAQALEMIHVYSLVHDDLPAMDNDDLRRGKATSHKQFDEATAILAGDALQTGAFELIANAQSLTDHQVRHMIVNLSQAAGAHGMVAGQMIDLLSENKSLQLTELEQLHRLKTGALIKSALRLGALCSHQVSDHRLQQLDLYGEALGLAFQITDDILDVTSSTEVLGKPQGSDIDAEKSTYVKLLGLNGAREKANEQCQLAKRAVTELQLNEASILWQLAEYVLKRNH